jgi:heavy metal sensor kinase
MKSLRLSLILYFLLLLAGALGGVSYFGYRSTQVAIAKQEESSRELTNAQYEETKKRVEDDFDQRVLDMAKDLADKAVRVRHEAEGLAVLNLLSITQFQPYLQGTFLLAPAYPPTKGRDKLFAMRYLTQRLRPTETRLIQTDDDDMIHQVEIEPGQYFQTFRLNGRPIERLKTSKDLNFQLSEEIRQKVRDGIPWFDTVTVNGDLKMRRVTLKAKVPMGPTRVEMILPPAMTRQPFEGTKGGFGPPPGKDAKFAPPSIEFILQFATDIRARDKNLLALQQKKEQDIANHQEKSTTALADLRQEMLWIGLGTFVAFLAGGFMLVHLGLSPINRLTEAVRKVSAKDFRLPIEAQKLPRELKPIAGRLEETLEELKRAFAREKQAAADISHELRTPLATLLTTIDVSLNKPRTPEYYREILEECRASGQHMNTLVERLLTLARLDAGASPIRPGAVDVNGLAQQCADLVRPLARARNLDLNVHTNGPAILNADPEKLREVINNLLSNAIEYNKPNGAIDLTVGRENGHLTVEVRDTGIGISPEAQPRIFERFFRADPSRHTDGVHAGLGLSIVKGYVDLMGGTVAVDSSDAGSTFRVHLPV